MSTAVKGPPIPSATEAGWLNEVGMTVWLMWALSGLTAFVAWAVTSYVVSADSSFSVGGYRLMLLVLWSSLVIAAGRAWADLQDQRAVWQARVSPRRPVQAARRVWRATLGCTAGIALLPAWTVALLAPPPGGAPAFLLFSAAAMLGSLSSMTLLTAAWRGELHSRWALPCGLWLGGFVLMPEAEWARWAAAEGWRAGVLLLALALPALASALLHPALRDDALLPSAVAGRPHRASLRARWQRWHDEGTSRLRALDGSARGGLLAISAQIPGQVLQHQEEGLLFMPWHSTVTMGGVARLLALSVFALLMMRSPSLHWRHFLAPGAVLRPRLGWQIALSTALAQLLSLGSIMAVTWGGLVWFSPDRALSWPEVTALAARYLPVWLLDLAFATALATLLRGWAGSLERAFTVLFALLLVCGAVYLGLSVYHRQPMPILGVRDGSYAALVGALTLLLLLAAQRVWSRADLGALLRASQAKPGVNET